MPHIKSLARLAVIVGLALGLASSTSLVFAADTGSTASTSISIPNPLGACNDATCLVSRVIKSILGIVAIIATFMFVWGGITMLTSGGNERQVKQAKETLTWAAIGIVVILLSWAVIRFVLQSFVTNSNSSSKKVTTTSRIVERLMV